MKKKITILILSAFAMLGCDNFLNIVPDNVATIDYAFRMKATAEKYLATCYSYLPYLGNPDNNPAIFGADEFWLSNHYSYIFTFNIAKGEQNPNNPLIDFWGGYNGGMPLWQGISQCNIFLENIMKVPDMMEEEKRRWAAEVKFLKAYYHFYLLRAYGPIPIMRENLPISASGEEVRVYRRPVDEVFDYIIELIDESLINLSETIRDEHTELGRITLPIALGAKAKILVYAASPLFNGNKDYQGFKNQDGEDFFNAEYDSGKWQKAVDACREAITSAHGLGYELYEFKGSHSTKNISPETQLKLSFRGVVTERWNSEIIWANTSSTTQYLQAWCAPRALDASQMSYTGSNGSFGVTLKIAGLFYSKNGVPINEDTQWNYGNRFDLRVGTENEKYYIKKGYTTAEFNFDREPRFYGALGFDGGIWYGAGKFDDDDSYWLESKRGQFLGKQQAGWHSVPGYFAKKLIYYTNTSTSAELYKSENYPWVMLRLGDLYLLYAEALNELNGPDQEVYDYINKIRTRAGLPDVEDSWTGYSKTPNKYKTQEGLREIIHQERGIEMIFEGQRFWDLRRWKEAPQELNKPITGWDVDQETAKAYYREKILFFQTFSLKDYFWPMRERDLIINKNLVQNPGW
ncbi:MAG: SusD family protein [Bacteroidetes bacterium ADurb.Bin174]|nr:MAG: SusD family protein [Bacteroidetes bacterium ADurb.Bin174]